MMNVRKRSHATAGDHQPGTASGSRPGSRRRLKSFPAWLDNIGLYATLFFVVIGLLMFLFFDFHHHEYTVETGEEIDEEGNPVLPIVEATESEANPAGGVAVVDSVAKPAISPNLRHAGTETTTTTRCKAKDIDTSRRFVTVVLPSVVNPEGRGMRLKAIADTWGCLARVVFVVHDLAEYPDAADNLAGDEAGEGSYPKLLLVPPSISLEQGVPRLQHVIKTVTEKLDPDFGFFINDHTFVIPEHACRYLVGRDPNDHMYAGHAMKNKQDTFAFNSGAAGYFLSRATMQGLVKRWDDKDPICDAENASEWFQGNPGLISAKCLSEAMHVNAVDTRDDNGWHRFHAFGLVRTVTGKVDQWYLNKHLLLDDTLGVDKANHHKPKNLNECCSSETISFHYVEHAETVALYNVLNALKESPSMTDDELSELVVQSWPKGFRNLGGYSHGLPKEKTEEWSSLLTILRRISKPATRENDAKCEL